MQYWIRDKMFCTDVIGALPDLVSAVIDKNLTVQSSIDLQKGFRYHIL